MICLGLFKLKHKKHLSTKKKKNLLNYVQKKQISFTAANNVIFYALDAVKIRDIPLFPSNTMARSKVLFLVFSSITLYKEIL